MRVVQKHKFITSQDVNTRVKVYNGRQFKILFIKGNMVGFHFGEFITTRRFCVKFGSFHISKKNKGNRKS